jgi:hypothetical protein
VSPTVPSSTSISERIGEVYRSKLRANGHRNGNGNGGLSLSRRSGAQALEALRGDDD